MTSLSKNLKAKPIFFSLQTTRLAKSFEHLNSSLALKQLWRQSNGHAKPRKNGQFLHEPLDLDQLRRC